MIVYDKKTLIELLLNGENMIILKDNIKQNWHDDHEAVLHNYYAMSMSRKRILKQRAELQSEVNRLNRVIVMLNKHNAAVHEELIREKEKFKEYDRDVVVKSLKIHIDDLKKEVESLKEKNELQLGEIHKLAFENYLLNSRKKII